MLKEYKAQAIEAERGLRAEEQRIMGDANLSQAGRLNALQQARDRYQAKVRQLQSQARTFVEAELGRVERRRRDLAEDAYSAHLSTVGADIAADIIRRRVELMRSDQISAFVEEAAHPFEREVARAYGALELERRFSDETAGGDEGLRLAYKSLAAADKDGDVQDLLEHERSLRKFDAASLDIAERRKSLSEAMGVQGDLLPEEAL